MRVQSCYFANLDLLVFCHSRCRRRPRCLSSRLKYLQWSLHSKLLFCQSIPIALLQEPIKFDGLLAIAVLVDVTIIVA